MIYNWNLFELSFNRSGLSEEGYGLKNREWWPYLVSWTHATAVIYLPRIPGHVAVFFKQLFKSNLTVICTKTKLWKSSFIVLIYFFFH